MRINLKDLHQQKNKANIINWECGNTALIWKYKQYGAAWEN